MLAGEGMQAEKAQEAALFLAGLPRCCCCCCCSAQELWPRLATVSRPRGMYVSYPAAAGARMDAGVVAKAGESEDFDAVLTKVGT